MKTFNVTVNGKTYEVTVEEVGEPQAAPQAVALPREEVKAGVQPQKAFSAAAATPAKPATAPNKPAPGPVPAGAGVVKSPMPGTVMSVKVKPGDQVKVGQVLLILEAMKMENEITATMGGVVQAVHVSAGTAVNTDDPMVVIG